MGPTGKAQSYRGQRMAAMLQKIGTPLATAAMLYGGSRIAGADPKTAIAASVLGGLMRTPGPHQGPINQAMQVLVGDRSTKPKAATDTTTAPTVNSTTEPSPEQTALTAGNLGRYILGGSALGPGGSLLGLSGILGGGQQQQQQAPLVPPKVVPLNKPPDPLRANLPGVSTAWSNALDPLMQPPADPTKDPSQPGFARGGGVPGLSLKGLSGSRRGLPGVPSPLKGLHLKNPGGLKLGSMGNLMRQSPAGDPTKTLRHSDQNPSRMLGRMGNPMKSFGLKKGGKAQPLAVGGAPAAGRGGAAAPPPGLLTQQPLARAQGGPVIQDDPVADTRGNSWFFENVGTRTVPKQHSGILRDVADKSNSNVKANLPPALPSARSKGEQLMAKADKKAHGGPIRGKMSEALGGPKVPGSGLENPLPGGGKGKSVPMKFAKGGHVGKRRSGSGVVGAGCVVQGVRPAKKF